MSLTEQEIASLSRGERQRVVTDWCGRAFGTESQQDTRKRALRFLEEAIELFQSEGGEKKQAAALLDRVYSRPAGEPSEEVGGVSVTLLSYCSAAGLSADECEKSEIERVLNRPLGEAKQRYEQKVRDGF